MKVRKLCYAFIAVMSLLLYVAGADVCAQQYIQRPVTRGKEDDTQETNNPMKDYYSRRTVVGTFNVLENYDNHAFLLGHKGGDLEHRAVNMETGDEYPAQWGPRFGGYFDKEDSEVSRLLSEVFQPDEFLQIKKNCLEDRVESVFLWYSVNPRTGKVTDVQILLCENPDLKDKPMLSIPVGRFELLERLIRERWVFPDAPEESKVLDYIPCSNVLFPKSEF